MSTNATMTIASNSSAYQDTVATALSNLTYSDSTSITNGTTYVGNSAPNYINWGTAIPSIGDIYWNQNDNSMYIYDNTTIYKKKDNETMNNNFNFGIVNYFERKKFYYGN